MLSAKSVNFIDNLRLYLITSGKKEEEVKEVTEELKIHLIEAEKQGKNIDDIITDTPEAYMDSIKQEMKTDYTGIVRVLPLYFLGVIAYLIMGPAIRGELALNIIQVIGFPIISIVGLLIYVNLLRGAGKHQYSSKKLFFKGMIASGSVTGLFILILLGSTLLVEPFYQASTMVNWIVVSVCAFVFIAGAIWSKTWFTIWIPGVLFIPDFLFRYSNMKDETILIISAGSFPLIFVIMILSLYLKKK